MSDIKTIRERARKHIEQGAVTPGYGANRATVLQLLNEALATELVCVLRYRRHYFMAKGAVGEAIKGELLKHATEEQAHADLIAERIVQLGGEPDFNPAELAGRSHAQYIEGTDLASMVEEDLVAERDSHRVLYGNDPVHRPGGFHDQADAGRNPRQRGRARRGTCQPADDAAWRSCVSATEDIAAANRPP